jgi:hypothetical protein
MSKSLWDKATEEVIKRNKEFLIELGKHEKDRKAKINRS